MTRLFGGSLHCEGFVVSAAESDLLTVHAETIAAVQKVLLSQRDRAIVRLVNQLSGRTMKVEEFTGRVSLTVADASPRDWVFGLKFEIRRKKRTRSGRERAFVELTLRTRRGPGDARPADGPDRNGLVERPEHAPVCLAFAHGGRAYRASGTPRAS